MVADIMPGCNHANMHLKGLEEYEEYEFKPSEEINHDLRFTP